MKKDERLNTANRKNEKSKAWAYLNTGHTDPASSKIAYYSARISRRRGADHAPQKNKEWKVQNPIMPQFPLDKSYHHQTEFFLERE